MISALSTALADIRAGIRRRAVWMTLASEDITDQHRRTSLGPLWLLLNYLAFAGTFILIFGQLRETGEGFTAYVAIGLFVWLYLAETVSKSISLYVNAEGFIKGTRLPLSVYVFRVVAQNVLRSSYALVGCVAIVLLAGTTFSVHALWSLAGVFIILATTPAVVIILATAGAFLPDLQYVVQNVMRLGLFLTPIFWMADGNGGPRQILSQWNPFAYYLEIVRSPILDMRFPAFEFSLCIFGGLLFWFIALLLLGKFNKQIVLVL